MTYVVDRNVPDGAQVAAGAAPGWSVVNKFGRNASTGTSFVPVALGGIYRTPQSGSATALRIKAGNSGDISNGAGARQVTLQGIDETGALAEEVLDTNGTSASSNSTTTFMRLFRAFVSASGTYATASAGSHSAAIVVENSAGTEDWATISATDFPRGQTEIACYTVPTGYTAYVGYIRITVAEANKPLEALFFRRDNILETAAPYSSMRVINETAKITEGSLILSLTYPLGPFPANTDIGFMAKAATGTPEVDIDFEVLLWDGT